MPTRAATAAGVRSGSPSERSTSSSAAWVSAARDARGGGAGAERECHQRGEALGQRAGHRGIEGDAAEERLQRVAGDRAEPAVVAADGAAGHRLGRGEQRQQEFVGKDQRELFEGRVELEREGPGAIDDGEVPGAELGDAPVLSDGRAPAQRHVEEEDIAGAAVHVGGGPLDDLRLGGDRGDPERADPRGGDPAEEGVGAGPREGDGDERLPDDLAPKRELISLGQDGGVPTLLVAVHDRENFTGKRLPRQSTSAVPIYAKTAYD